MTNKITAANIKRLLREKYQRDRYAMLFEVPDAVGTSARRRIDAIAFDCWKSGGRKLEGFEIKVSRSDWLRETAQVDKAAPFVALCDHFWLVTSDVKIAKLEEIPACWGWMTATPNGLLVQRPAAPLPGAGKNLPRDFVIGVLRKLQDDLINSPDVAAYVQERLSIVQHELDALRERVQQFEEKSGIGLDDWVKRHAAETTLNPDELDIWTREPEGQ